VLATSSVTGITINTGANDIINLRGLEIDGAGSGANGILFNTGGLFSDDDVAPRREDQRKRPPSPADPRPHRDPSLNIQNCVICGLAPPPTAPEPAPAQTTTAKNIVTDFGAKCNGVGNDNAAFTAFNTWARTQTLPITLTIPSGSVCMFSTTTGASGNWFAKGIKNLLVIGYGATISDNNGDGNGVFLGGIGVINAILHSSRVATVAAGATTVTLLNASESSRFKVGNWALMTGLDLMGYGYPPNPAFFDYVQITAINAGTGAITFAAPLKNGYKSTWPLYWAGNALATDQGGPATLYALDPSWDTQVEYQGLTFSQEGQTYANGRSITYRDVTFTGTACGIPTQNLVWQAINVTATNCSVEVDKIIDTMTVSGGTWKAFGFQSSSVHTANFINGVNITGYINGTPQTFNCNGSTIADLELGAIAFGASLVANATNCSLPIIGYAGYRTNVNAYTISNGVILSPIAVNGPIAWCVPGTKPFFSGSLDFEGSFTITGLTASGGNAQCATSLSGNSFPTLPRQGGTDLFIQTNQAPIINFVGNTGSADAIDLSQAGARNAPLYTYSQRTYTCLANVGNVPNSLDINSPPGNLGPIIWGAPISITVNVSRADTSAVSPLPWHFFSSQYINGAGAAVIIDEIVSLRTAGTRTMTPSTTTGSQAGDTLVNLGAVLTFTQTTSPSSPSPNVTNNAGICPVATVTIQTSR
jgi:hypothetical protein